MRSRLIAREPLGVALPDRPPQGGGFNHRSDRPITIPAAAGSGLRLRVVQEISDPFMILTLVAAGVGVALMSDGVAAIMPSGSVFVPLRGRPTHVDHAIARAADNRSAVLSAVLALVDEVIPTPA